LQHHLPVYQPLTLKDGEQQEILYQLNADIMVVAAYGMILPAAVLSCTKFGCINIHPPSYLVGEVLRPYNELFTRGHNNRCEYYAIG